MPKPTKKSLLILLAVAIYVGHLALAPALTYLVYVLLLPNSLSWWIWLLIFVLFAAGAIVSHTFFTIRWRTHAYQLVPETEWESLRNAQITAGLDDTTDRLGLIKRLSRPEDDEIAFAINQHLNDNFEVERVNLDFSHGEIKVFKVASSRLLPIAIAKVWLVTIGVFGVVAAEDYLSKLWCLVYALAAIFIYPNYAHWRHMFHRGVGFEINSKCFGSIYPNRQIIYWKDVDRFYVVKRGWRKFLVVELYLGITYQFDVSLYSIGGIDYFAELMKMYWDRNEQS